MLIYSVIYSRLSVTDSYMGIVNLLLLSGHDYLLFPSWNLKKVNEKNLLQVTYQIMNKIPAKSAADQSIIQFYLYLNINYYDFSQSLLAKNDGETQYFIMHLQSLLNCK